MNTVKLFKIAAQCRDIHCLLILKKAILRDDTIVNKETLLKSSIAAAIKDHTGYEMGSFRLVQEFAGDITGKILTAPGIRRILIHIRTQIAIQCTLRFFIRRLVKIAGIGFAEENNLQRVNHRRFTGAVFTGQKIDILYFYELFGKVQPVNQQDLL